MVAVRRSCVCARLLQLQQRRCYYFHNDTDPGIMHDVCDPQIASALATHQRRTSHHNKANAPAYGQSGKSRGTKAATTAAAAAASTLEGQSPTAGPSDAGDADASEHSGSGDTVDCLGIDSESAEEFDDDEASDDGVDDETGAAIGTPSPFVGGPSPGRGGTAAGTGSAV